MDKAFYYWKNVDSALKGMTVIELAHKACLNYKTIKNQRSSVRLPNLDDALAIAKTLGVSMEYLLTGESEQTTALSPRVQAVVSCLEDDEDKLRAVETLLGLGKKASPMGGVPKGTVGA